MAGSGWYDIDSFAWDERHWGYDVRVPLVSGISYLICILSLQQYMSKREAMKLVWPCAIHNFALSAFSLVVMIGQVYEGYIAIQRIGAFPVFCWQEPTSPSGRLYFWCVTSFHS
mmetsp:Transcript_70721/g.188784  ORF Transcript_70721/g.188784 Transcript_70721/m.188784 type:complete len:114 (+) Transcript_70721:26-367(+)